jgi:hypothetical protein
VRIFEDLVRVEDSRVFWNQSLQGFPLVLAQRCFNRHGGFLVVEEFNGDRRSDSIIVLEDKTGKGWELFGLELRWVFEYLRARSRPVPVDIKAQVGKEKRSYAEVLARTAPPLEEPLGVVSELVAKVPRWVKELSEGRHCEGMPTANSGQVSVLSKRRFIAPAAFSAPVNFPVKHTFSYGAGQDAAKGCGVSDITCHLGDRIDFLSLRDTLLQLKVDVGAYLERVDGLLGSVENQARLSLKSCPMCLMDNALGSQHKSVEASLGGNGIGAGEFSRFIGRSKPKTKPKPKPKAVYRQKTKLDRGVDPKGVALAQPSSLAHSSSDRPWVRMNLG